MDESHALVSARCTILHVARLSLVQEASEDAKAAAVADTKAKFEEALLKTYDVQAVAARGVGHTSEEGLAEALYLGFIAQLRAEGLTEQAAKHMAAFWGEGAYEVQMPAHPGEGDEEEAGGEEEGSKDEL